MNIQQRFISLGRNLAHAFPIVVIAMLASFCFAVVPFSIMAAISNERSLTHLVLYAFTFSLGGCPSSLFAAVSWLLLKHFKVDVRARVFLALFASITPAVAYGLFCYPVVQSVGGTESDIIMKCIIPCSLSGFVALTAVIFQEKMPQTE